MTTTTLIQSLYEIGAIKFGEFTLKSGQISKIYLDMRQIISYPETLREVANAIWDKIHACHFDLICGVPYTALPIATCISLQHNFPMILRRKEKKSYGTKQQIEGKFQAGQRCLIIEDVITTGSSILETIEDLEAQDLMIKDLVTLIDREQGGKENLQKRNYKLHTVFTLNEIMNILLKTELLTPAERTIINTLIHEKV
jgi:orotate phosphoribosyltransferase